MKNIFNIIATKITKFTGSSPAFIAALVIIIIWLITGPIFHYSEVWQLVINTFTTIVTFLMTFLIQHTQNKDQQALHKKVDNLIQSIKEADDSLIGIESKNEE